VSGALAVTRQTLSVGFGGIWALPSARRLPADRPVVARAGADGHGAAIASEVAVEAR
jgi:hypothetical protein